MRCAFCSADLPSTVTGALDTLYAECPSGCDGAGRFNVTCPACGRVVATFDVPLGYDAQDLAERLGLPFESPWLTDRPASLSIEDRDFQVMVDGQTVTATVLGKTTKYGSVKIQTAT